MADETTFQTSVQPQETVFDFESRQFAWLPDSNNGSYSNGQIIWDAASLANSGKFIDWSQSMIAIPLVLNVNLGAVGVAAVSAEQAFTASLKNGYHQLINSLSVELSNSSVVNLTQLSGLDINYKLLTTCSREDELSFLPSINFSKDTAESFQYQAAAANLNGIGECNNQIKAETFNPASGWGETSFNQNTGRLERMKNTSFDPSTTLNTAAKNYTSEAATKATAKNYVAYTTTNVTYFILATIPMKILHDIFRKLPLAMGTYARIICNTHASCSATVGTGAAGVTYTSCTSSTQNGVLPFMLSPAGTGNGALYKTDATSTITATMGIGSAAGLSHVIQQARLYACLYTMSPIYMEKYLSLAPTKKVLYNDILQFSSSVIQSGGALNQILTNSISRPRYLLGIPFLAGSINGSADIRATSFLNGAIAGATAISTLASPFSTAPATCLPLHAISNFNVLVSGSAIYQSNYQYKFEHFLQEVRSSNALNGGVTLGMTSGLLSQTDWENSYGYIYVDLSRKSGQAQDDVGRSIQVQLNNIGPTAVEYLFFIGYEREITISTSTGALVI